jgi:hypothetical protein
MTKIELADGREITLDDVKAAIPLKHETKRQTDPGKIDVGRSELFEAFGYEILEWITTGSYQGDYVVLARYDGRFFFTVIGFGSCGGCDAWIGTFSEGSPGPDEYPKLADWIASTHRSCDVYDSLAELKAGLGRRITSREEDNDWYDHDDEIVGAMKKICGKEYP